MIDQTLDDAMRDACAVVGIEVPRKAAPGRWAQCPVKGKPRTNTSGRVMIFDDETGGICWNWSTGEQRTFRVGGAGSGKVTAPRRDPERDRREREEQAEVARICAAIVRDCAQEPHPYLAAKGFPDEYGLVCADPWRHLPAGRFGEALTRSLPEGDGPLLVVPGRIGKTITTIQFITPEGAKKNILRGRMGGASHRIATGRETWVCEGIATALSVRAALRFLGRSATVLCAFSAQNVARVARGIPGAIIAADHDRPLDQFGGKGTGEFWAASTGLRWTMPLAQGDFNDWHMREGLRAVALHLRGIGMG